MLLISRYDRSNQLMPYHVTLALTNVADVPFYNVALTVDRNKRENLRGR